MSDLTPDPMTSYEAAEVAATIADADDIVDRLRDPEGISGDLCLAAADEIVKLRAALEEVVLRCDQGSTPHHHHIKSAAAEALSDE